MEDLDYLLDYVNYDVPKKNVIDIDDILSVDKPKLNRNNRVFAENLDMLMFPDVPDITQRINMSLDINEREDSNNVKQQDSKPVPK